MENSLSEPANDNLRIWNKVNETDPAHTKKVEFGRKFTSIDAHWQILQATKQFGPIGCRWGYDVAHTIHDFPGSACSAIADVTIWYYDGVEKCAWGPIRGCAPYVEYDGEGKPKKNNKGLPLFDDDAGKKAMTDALTKALSHLGFSADVFLKLFDDNKYVQRMEQKFNAERATQPDALPDDIRGILDRIKACKSNLEVEALALAERPNMVGKAKAHVDLIGLKIKEARAKFAPAVAAE